MEKLLTTTSFSTGWESFSTAPIAIFCLVTETKGQTFHWIPGFYSTSGVVNYTTVIFSAHLVALKCVECCFTSTETVVLLETGAQDGHLDFHTAPELCDGEMRFLLLLVPGKYSYVLGQQPSCCVPPHFQQIAYSSQLSMCKDLSERGLFTKCGE